MAASVWSEADWKLTGERFQECSFHQIIPIHCPPSVSKHKFGFFIFFNPAISDAEHRKIKQ